jgi:hypothetical protein
MQGEGSWQSMPATKSGLDHGPGAKAVADPAPLAQVEHPRTVICRSRTNQRWTTPSSLTLGKSPMNPYRIGPFGVRVHDMTGNRWEEIGCKAMDAARECFPPRTRLQVACSMGGLWKNPPAQLDTDDLYWAPNLGVSAYDDDKAFECVHLFSRETICSRLVVIDDVTGNGPDEIAQKALSDAQVREVFGRDELVQVDFLFDLETEVPDHLSTTDRYYAQSVWVSSVD